MEQLPIALNLKGRSVAVSGGGLSAARRAGIALRAEADVTVVHLVLGPEFESLEGHPPFRHSNATVGDNGTRPNLRVVTATIASIADLVVKAGLEGPSMILVGSVVSLRDRLACFKPETAAAPSTSSLAAAHAAIAE